jgi:hypothetical protein
MQNETKKDGLLLEISRCSFRGVLKKADSPGITCGITSPASPDLDSTPVHRLSRSSRDNVKETIKGLLGR